MAGVVRQRDADRLAGLMARWWEGWAFSRIGAEYGVSRQRVQRILATVGCTEKARRQADRGAPIAGRGPSVVELADIRSALEHPLVHHLTSRQRAALAWRLQRLCLAEVGRRMGISRQGAEQVIRRALARMYRVEAAREPEWTLADLESIELDWDELLGDGQ